jgi:hypothetical protein
MKQELYVQQTSRQSGRFQDNLKKKKTLYVRNGTCAVIIQQGSSELS